MVNKPDSNKSLSIKTKLLLILIMFVVINVIFYFGFDSSDESNESGNSIEIDNPNQSPNELTVELGEGIGISSP